MDSSFFMNIQKSSKRTWGNFKCNSFWVKQLCQHIIDQSIHKHIRFTEEASLPYFKVSFNWIQNNNKRKPMSIRKELVKTWSTVKRKSKMDSCVPGGDAIFFRHIQKFLSQGKAIPLFRIYRSYNLISPSDIKSVQWFFFVITHYPPTLFFYCFY